MEEDCGAEFEHKREVLAKKTNEILESNEDVSTLRCFLDRVYEKLTFGGEEDEPTAKLMDSEWLLLPIDAQGIKEGEALNELKTDIPNFAALISVEDGEGLYEYPRGDWLPDVVDSLSSDEILEVFLQVVASLDVAVKTAKVVPKISSFMLCDNNREEIVYKGDRTYLTYVGKTVVLLYSAHRGEEGRTSLATECLAFLIYLMRSSKASVLNRLYATVRKVLPSLPEVWEGDNIPFIRETNDIASRIVLAVVQEFKPKGFMIDDFWSMNPPQAFTDVLELIERRRDLEVGDERDDLDFEIDERLNEVDLFLDPKMGAYLREQYLEIRNLYP